MIMPVRDKPNPNKDVYTAKKISKNFLLNNSHQD